MFVLTGTGSRPAGDYTSRVRSLTHEVSPGNNGSYTWTNLVPGTYLYKSGTHIQVQVPMGLYGAMKKNAVDPDAGVSGEAYPGASFDADQVLLFSEVDPVILDAVVSGTYGTGDLTSTTDYQPGYFLINGEAYESGRSPLPAAPVGQTTLLRFLNAGNLDYTPVIHSPLMDVIAEDGKPYPFTRKQYSIPLVAGKTLDALLTPTEVGSIPIYDRALHLSNAAQYPGGMRIYLDVPDAPPGFAVTYPNGGEGLSRGSAYDITWSYQGDPGPFVRIELWRADGAGTLTTRQAVLAPSAPIGSAGAGSFSWRIIPRIPSTTYKIKIISTTDGLITDESDNIFNIN